MGGKQTGALLIQIQNSFPSSFYLRLASGTTTGQAAFQIHSGRFGLNDKDLGWLKVWLWDCNCKIFYKYCPGRLPVLQSREAASGNKKKR
jgi:hypothetical protein